ncbi:Hypothetical predicted protein [Marmota monax]|uniref:Uncharacterized protein n=1 Tax=Marmota monax TaxID=9995 RepID=A0A5E4AQY4_MARMO|nr:hypothetical protein GHT09_003603 [Marmota monax]VTJ59186.1 Hypothetical predicted protein [Marmota monax]
MEEVIAGLERLTFAFERDVELQRGTGLLPFQGMDKSASAMCVFFAKGLCGKACGSSRAHFLSPSPKRSLLGRPDLPTGAPDSSSGSWATLKLFP